MNKNLNSADVRHLKKATPKARSLKVLSNLKRYIKSAPPRLSWILILVFGPLHGKNINWIFQRGIKGRKARFNAPSKISVSL